jgi:hypothetical protein
MDGSAVGQVSVALTTAEARIVVAALRQFEPYWPTDLDEMGRADLLAEIREAIDHIGGAVSAAGG